MNHFFSFFPFRSKRGQGQIDITKLVLIILAVLLGMAFIAFVIFKVGGIISS